MAGEVTAILTASSTRTEPVGAKYRPERRRTGATSRRGHARTFQRWGRVRSLPCSSLRHRQGSQQRGGADLHHVVRGSADDDGDVFHAFADSGVPWHGRVDPDFHLSQFRAFRWRGGGNLPEEFHHPGPAPDLGRGGLSGSHRLHHAGDHRESLQRDLAGSPATPRCRAVPPLLGDPQPGPIVAGCRLRRDHLHRFAVAAPWPGRVAGRGDAAGADAAGVQRGGLHPALFGGPERPGPGAPCPDGRRVHRGTVRSRENPVRAVRKPVSRLPADLRCLRHRAYLPAVDLSFLDDRSIRRGAGLQSLFFPSLAAALAAQADRPARRAEGVPPAPAAWTIAAPDPLASCGLVVARG